MNPNLSTKTPALRAFYSVLFAAFSLFYAAIPAKAAAQDSGVQPAIHVIRFDGAIGPVAADFITRALEEAEKEKATCFILELDTPGGLLESTRDITKSFLAAEIPVVVYVYPVGARAASAGVFISYAAHLVAMAPSTNIGAATPVNLGGGSDTTSAMSHKVTNDAVAQVKAMAEKRGRNAEWVELAIRKAVSITETEALEMNVINFISPNLDSLIAQIDGREVEVASGNYRIETENAKVVVQEMNLRYRILQKISDPNIIYFLMMFGILGIFFELSNPGSIFPGVVGAIFLILALFALQTLPVNYAGLLLIGLALVLFILEVKIISYGLLTIGGLISMILGTLMLFEQPPGDFGGAMTISIKLVVGISILIAALIVFALSLAIKSHRKKVTTGSEGIIGEIGVAETRLAPDGRVKVHGEIWKASSENQIKKGDKIRVVAVSGLTLKVERI